MSKKMDRIAVRRPVDLERKYNFAQVRKTAEEAKSIAISKPGVDAGLSAKVQSLEDALNGEGGINAQLASKVGVDVDGNLASRVKVKGKFTIEVEKLTLAEDGTITILAGSIGGCPITDGKLYVGDAYVSSAKTVKDLLVSINECRSDLTIMNRDWQEHIMLLEERISALEGNGG